MVNLSQSENALDLLSTSQTNPRCGYGAPLVAILKDGFGTIQQGCCNHWDCPRCGVMRAKQEYRRIVTGAEIIGAAHKLYFWTLTCRGKECSLEEAEASYYAWTNVLLTNARTKAARAEIFWAYVQVTERQHQTRHHPHSHLLTTFCPPDALLSHDEKGREIFISAWFDRANQSAGLGSRHQITQVRAASGVSRYVAKYMFKAAMMEKWPPKWKRVRYSQNWPKAPHWTPDWAISLLTPSDWQAASSQSTIWVCETLVDYERARHRLANIARGDVPLIDQMQRDAQIRISML